MRSDWAGLKFDERVDGSGKGFDRLVQPTCGNEALTVEGYWGNLEVKASVDSSEHIHEGKNGELSVH
jgi:hypothetical protein